jgi:hypothetical protein
MMSDNNGGATQTNPPQDREVVMNAPRTAWEVIEQACNEHVTGELTITTGSPAKTKVYLLNGLVYFAERETDETLATRLVLAGALNLEQLHRGTIRLNGVEHLGRMFERDESIDRDAVELAIELVTEQTLTDIADQHVVSYRISLYRHHSSGIARWFSGHHSLEEEAPFPSASEQVAAPVVAPQAEPPVSPVEHVVEEPRPTEPDPSPSFDAQRAIESTPGAEIQAEPGLMDAFGSVPEEQDAVAAALSILAPWEPDPPTAPNGSAPSFEVEEIVEIREAVLEHEAVVEQPAPVEHVVEIEEPARVDEIVAVVEPPAAEEPPAVEEVFATVVTAEILTAADATEPEPELQLAPAASPWGAPQPSAMAMGPMSPPAPAPVASDVAPAPSAEPSPPAVEEPALVRPFATESPRPTILPTDFDALTPLYGGLQPLTRITPAEKPAAKTVEAEPAPVHEPAAAEPVLPAAQAQLSTLTPLTPLPRIVPLAPSAPSASAVSAMASATNTAPVPVTESASSHSNLVVPDLGSIPVPEEVAAAVRRAITAIEAATLAPTGTTPVTFGPLHVTAVGQATTNGAATLHQLGSAVAVDTMPPDQYTGGYPPVTDEAVPEAVWAPAPQKPQQPQPQSLQPLPMQPQTLQPIGTHADLAGTGALSMNGSMNGSGNGSVMSMHGNDAMATLSPLVGLPTLPPPEVQHNNPVAAPISTKRRGALRRLIDGIRGR